MTEFSLKVGESAAVRPRWWGKSWSVIYTGTQADGTCSIAVMWTMGHNSAAYNLYLTEAQREFRLPVGRVQVVEHSAAGVRLRFRRRGDP